MASMTHDSAKLQRNARTVLLVRPTFQALEDLMSKSFHILKAWESPLPLPEFLAAQAGAVRALLIRGNGSVSVDAKLLSSLPSLRLIVTNSVGVDFIDMAECARRGISVANAGNVLTEDVAEYAFGLLMDVLRRISAANRYVSAGLWPLTDDFPLGSKLGGKRVGIVGLGRIGSAIAKRLDAFGCIISYHSRKQKPSSYTFYPNARSLAAHNDILVVCCALNNNSYHIIDRDVMEALGKEGIIINVGRGALIDEDELVRRLVQGEIGGAGLDVFENEPAVPKELFSMDKASDQRSDRDLSEPEIAK
ncbi:glyoxylate/hydroxypyruvate reductase HPR3-like isoform X2 [Phalaenopsis equestris]|uniref:glyoxylate/hydroxypyruvate reductase HPR3-like isoform X2 n=1 Tax=Phalaenopsis equestris TaxID=78828 RepID=UPI0009E52689|nr:glyoxylate/hydroxypyruvate reductase HPR3-like isoform X2 [Phalaenopsis equestris]XP_020573201.1 glyoxylate/hydroxypyruvate reductase HPR3-like isoform X2 [Phalaenopsis equestris]